MGRLSGKIALITGAASGIGAGEARVMAENGAQVIVADIDMDAGRAIAAAIPGASFIRLDVTHEEGWEHAVSEIVGHHGRIDVLVNNAGVVRFGTIEEATLDDWRFVTSVSIEGTFLGCKHAIPAMRRSSGASIINMSSTSTLKGYPNVAAYTAAKGAVRALTRNVASHCALQGYPIRCNVILAGTIDTPMLKSAIDAAAPPELTAGRPLAEGNIGTPDDIAQLVVYLASDESRFMNGSELLIDGAELSH